MRPIASLQDDASSGVVKPLQLMALPSAASSMSRSCWSMAAIRDRTCCSLLGSKCQISAPAKPTTAMSADVLRVHLTFLLPGVSGKRTARLCASVTDEVAEALTRTSRERGYESVSQCLEELAPTSLYGEDAVVSFHAKQVPTAFQRSVDSVVEVKR